MSARPRARPTLKGSTIELRLSPAQKELIAEAARARQQTLTGFMVEHAVSAAEQVLAERVHFAISPERWEAFCAALDAPAKDIPALRRLLSEESPFDGD
jgi:uncharacterized protein (DUF1778 family)